MSEVEIYSIVGISDALDAADVTVLKSANLSTGVHSSGTVTIGSTAVDIVDITKDVVNVAENFTYGELESTQIGSRMRSYVQGKGTEDITVSFYGRAGTSTAWTKLVKEKKGVKLFFAERHNGEQLVALVSAFTVNKPAADESGRLVLDTNLKNAGDMEPVWS